MIKPVQHRSIFISDIHLGTRDAKSHYLLEFLQQNSCEHLYLVGDIFDLWKLKRGWHWPEENNALIAHVIAMARNGTCVTYIPGNHDEMLREYCGGDYLGVLLRREVIHHGANGKHYLVLHGDEFDCIVRNNKWLAYLGDGAYELLLRLNHWFNLARRCFGLDYWSLSAFLKQQAKGAVNFISRFESIVCNEASRRSVDGVICGHIHHATQHHFDGCSYKNTGDWVESCTALIEDETGNFQILNWSELRSSFATECNENDTGPTTRAA